MTVFLCLGVLLAPTSFIPHSELAPSPASLPPASHSAQCWGNLATALPSVPGSAMGLPLLRGCSQRAKPSGVFKQLAACPGHQPCQSAWKGPARQPGRQWGEAASPDSPNLCLDGQAYPGNSFIRAGGGARAEV